MRNCNVADRGSHIKVSAVAQYKDLKRNVTCSHCFTRYTLSILAQVKLKALSQHWPMCENMFNRFLFRCFSTLQKESLACIPSWTHSRGPTYRQLIFLLYTANPCNLSNAGVTYRVRLSTVTFLWSTADYIIHSSTHKGAQSETDVLLACKFAGLQIVNQSNQRKTLCSVVSYGQSSKRVADISWCPVSSWDIAQNSWKLGHWEFQICLAYL